MLSFSSLLTGRQHPPAEIFGLKGIQVLKEKLQFAQTQSNLFHSVLLGYEDLKHHGFQPGDFIY